MTGFRNPSRHGKGDQPQAGGGGPQEGSAGRGPPPPVPLPVPGRTDGFTIVELLVSLFIFGLLSAAGVALLSFSVRAQALAGERLDEISQFRRFGAIVTSDLAQASPRISRDGNGAVRPAFVGGTGLGEPASVSLVRRGWDNLDGSQRSSLQKVEYRVSGNRLERIAYRHVDGGAALDPMLLLDGVGSLRLRYRDERGEWRDRWDPVRPVDLPRAVEMVMDVERIGPVRLLFLVGPPS